MSNPLEDIVKLYNESVEEADQAGYADKFKTATEKFFDGLGCYFKEHNFGEVHVTDIEYLDGYFIFGYGTNSVVHFHIDECPSWKFGIWWNAPEDTKKKYVTGDFFAQFEETIDKFKPSASVISTTFNVVPESQANEYTAYEAYSIISFIHNEPYLAFCRDYMYWDYNTEYHSREEAKAAYDDYRQREDKEVRVCADLDKQMLDWVENNMLPEWNNAKIIDRGDSWSPRYQIVAPFVDNTEFADEPGYYGLDKGDPIAEEFKKLQEKLHQIALDEDVYWSYPIHADCMLYAEAEDEV